MNKLPFLETLIAQQSDGTALTNSTTAASLLAAAAKYTLENNYFDIGRAIRLIASGRISTAAATPGTFSWGVKFGSTQIFTPAASPTVQVSQTNVPWWLEILLTCRAIGASANLLGTGLWVTPALSTPLVVSAAPPAVGSNFDSTAAQQVDLVGTWSVASASNSIQLHQFALVAMN